MPRAASTPSAAELPAGAVVAQPPTSVASLLFFFFLPPPLLDDVAPAPPEPVGSEPPAPVPVDAVVSPDVAEWDEVFPDERLDDVVEVELELPPHSCAHSSAQSVHTQSMKST